MKKAALLIILIVAFSCKDDKKDNTETQQEVAQKEPEYKTIKSFTDQDLIIWSKTRVDLVSNENEDSTNSVYTLKRNSETESCFLTTSLIPVLDDNEYRASVKVKKRDKGQVFGLRMTGSYPDRVDAVFDLSKGTLIEVKASRDFERPNATIEDLGDGWYQCTISARVAAENIRIILGPSTLEKSVLGWEGKTGELGEIDFIPSSVILEEILR